MTAALLASPPAVSADSTVRFVGSVQRLSGNACGPNATVDITLDGSLLTFIAIPGPMFRGDIRHDGSFRLLPASPSLVYRKMLAPPVLEGRISGGQIVGEITSHWCAYHFTAQRA